MRNLKTKVCVGQLWRVCSFAAILLAACSGGVRAGNPSPPTGKFTGLAGRVVTGEPGHEVPVAGAAIQVGQLKTVTDERGLWRFPSVVEGDADIAIGVSHPRFAPNVRVFPRSQITGRFVSMRVRPVAASKRINVKTGGVIVVPSSGKAGYDAAVRIPPGALALDTSDVDVAVSIVRPAVTNELQSFPGSYIGVGSSLPKGEDLLRTLGTLEVSFSNGGMPLGQVNLATPAQLQLVLDDKYGAEFAEGATIPTWSLDPASGTWLSEGSAHVIKQDDRKIAVWEAAHFTWWNVDKPLSEHACVAVKLLPADEAARRELAHLTFTLEGIDYAGLSRSAPFDANGVAIATGWRQHKVRPVLRYAGYNEASLMTSAMELGMWGGNAVFTMPATNASTVFNVGPNGVPLNYERHCLYKEYSFALQTGVVRGRVFDEFGRPLTSAVVAIPEVANAVVSAADGSFEFAGVPWREEGDLKISVSALPSASRPDLVFEPRGLIRDTAASYVELVPYVRESPPDFSELQVSNSTPPIGSTVDFIATVSDSGADLQWGTQLCGKVQVVATKIPAPEDGKVVLCHVPPGNPANKHTIAVGAAAVDAHLAHGDYLGVCEGIDPLTPPAFDAGSTAGEAAACSSTVTELQASGEKKDHGFVYHLQGKWNGGNKADLQALNLKVKNRLGYETAAALTVSWRNNAPVLFLASPAYAAAGSNLVLTADATDPDEDQVTVHWTFNGADLGDGMQRTIGPVVAGPNYLLVTATDGKAWISQRYTLWGSQSQAAGSAPDTSLTSTPASPQASTMATFTFTSPLTTATFECALDAQSFAPCSSPHSVSGLADGTHTFAVRALDAGLADGTPAFVTWDIYLGWMSLSVGSFHGCAIWSPGDLACWGNNQSAEAGLGFTSPTVLTPTLVKNPMGSGHWVSVSAADDFIDLSASTCGTLDNGTLWCWGQNENQLLVSAVGPVTQPVRVGVDTDWRSVQLRSDGACALKSSGALWCWGKDGFGRFGNGGTADHPAPVPVTAAVSWKKISLGHESACGISSGGSLYCWGSNAKGQLGIAGGNRFVPTLVNVDVDWATVSVGRYHACAVKTTGSLWCWGESSGGKTGLVSDQPVPTLVSSSGWRSVSAILYATCGVRTDQTLWCWGTETNSLFGNGTTATTFTVPTFIPTAESWEEVLLSENMACGRKADHTLSCWGNNAKANLGAGIPYHVDTFNLIDDTRGWLQMTTYASHVCAIDGNLELYCTGTNQYGELGLGASSTNPVATFTRTGAGITWAKVLTPNGGATPDAYERSCALTTTGLLYCWGADAMSFGNGNSSITFNFSPVIAGAGKTWTDVASGWRHTCGLENTAKVWCWGGNSYGEAGTIPSGNNVLSPLQMNLTGAYTKVFASFTTSCALRDTGTLYCWGDNYYGLFANGTYHNSSYTPVTEPVHKWADIALGMYHACGLDLNHALWCWGANVYGEVGYSAAIPSTRVYPGQVGTDTDWQSIYVGTRSTCGIKTNGTLWCWGYLLFPWIGNTFVPTQVDASTNWLTIYPNDEFYCGLKTDGSQWCFGKQIYGEWGNNGLVRDVPQSVLSPR